MIGIGLDKYVTDMSEETQENHTDDIGDNTERPFVKARPKQTPSRHSTVSSAEMEFDKKLKRSVETDDQIASTWPYRTSRRRRSSSKF